MNGSSEEELKMARYRTKLEDCKQSERVLLLFCCVPTHKGVDFFEKNQQNS